MLLLDNDERLFLNPPGFWRVDGEKFDDDFSPSNAVAEDREVWSTTSAALSGVPKVWVESGGLEGIRITGIERCRQEFGETNPPRSSFWLEALRLEGGIVLFGAPEDNMTPSLICSKAGVVASHGFSPKEPQ